MICTPIVFRVSSAWYLRHFVRHFRYWKRLKRVRQTEIAARLGLDATTVNAWEHGKNFPSLGNLYRLCVEVFGIDVWEFFRRPRESFRRPRGRAGALEESGSAHAAA